MRQAVDRTGVRSQTWRMSSSSLDQRFVRLSLRDRLTESLWSVGTSVASALLAAGALYGVGEVSGVNDRIFDGTCANFDALSPAEQREVLTDAKAMARLDVDRDGDPCES